VPIIIFSEPKRAIWEEKALQLREETESHNARFYDEKCDMAPENASDCFFNWLDHSHLKITVISNYCEI